MYGRGSAPCGLVAVEGAEAVLDHVLLHVPEVGAGDLVVASLTGRTAQGRQQQQQQHGPSHLVTSLL